MLCLKQYKQSGSTGNYNWYFDAALTELLATAEEYTPDVILGSSTYYVTATENGCEGLPAEISITFEDCQIIIPTAFTPDDDQLTTTGSSETLTTIYPNNVVRYITDSETKYMNLTKGHTAKDLGVAISMGILFQ